MVGPSDIPCVGKIVERISDATVDPLFRGFGYMFCYKDFVNILNTEVRKLTIQEERVSEKTVEKRADGKIIKDHVLEWQKEVVEIQRSAKEFSEKFKNRSSWRCIQCLPIPKPISRFQLGREAEHKAKRVTELSDFGKDLLATEIAYLSPVENLPTTDTIFQNFESRKDAYRKVWDALVTEGSSMILGIYGMPGVGKTRLMEQIWKEALEKKIFDKVTRADVGSEKLDVIELQKQIASHLDCHLESKDDKKHRANQLKNSLINGGKVLVIFDDVWREIPLDNIGIPFGDGSSCKILLTSREEAVCLRNNCKDPVNIRTLTVDEAWALFRNTVGACHIDSLQDESLVKKVCDKCAGLPLLIRAVGKALQFKSDDLWKDALGQLGKGKFENIAGIDPEVYACVKLSIDRLPDDAKSCLFLCSLYREDAVVHIRELIPLATGSLVPDGESRICAMVNILKSSSLLLDTEEDHVIKLHDLIRDVARSIATRDPKYAFLIVKSGSRLPDITDYCTRKLLHLHLVTNEFRFPDDLVCPDLHNLWLECNEGMQLQVSERAIGIFGNLKFLLFEGMSFTLTLQFSLQTLGKLRTLILKFCDISQINVSFFPENLETLCIWNCDLPVPLELPKMKYLRKLEIKGGRPGVQLLPNSISSLPSLEELHIPNGFEDLDAGPEISWDAVSAPILVEISKLAGLKSLQMYFRNFEPFQNTNIFENLLEFNICVGDPGEGTRYCPDLSGVSFKKSIELYGNQLEVLVCLIEKAEDVKLHGTDMNVSSIHNRNREAFANLRNLWIEECDTMEYLAMMSEDEIYYSSQSQTSFSKLTTLEIINCSTVKYLFNNFVAKSLVQLQKLCIENCPVMEAVVVNEGRSGGEIIFFSKLKSLELRHLPKLKSFSKEKKDMHSSATSIMDKSVISSVQPQPLFDEMVAFHSLEELFLENLEDMTDIWGKYYNDNVSSFCRLKSLPVLLCNKLETFIQLSMLHRLRNLECIVLHDCDSLRNAFQPSMARDLMHLREMFVANCEMMREIIGPGEQEITDAIVFTELKLLCLENLPNLTRFWCYQSEEANNYKVVIPNLVKLTIRWATFSLEDIRLGIDDSACQLMRLSVYCGKETQLLSNWLLNLEILSLNHWPSELKSLCFQRLKVLEVRNSDCSNLFTFSAFKSLQQLQTLAISNSAFLQEIVVDVRGEEASVMDKKTVILSQLKSVTLRNLPNLKSFIHSANFECRLPSLTEVKVDNCGISTLFTCCCRKCEGSSACMYIIT